MAGRSPLILGLCIVVACAATFGHSRAAGIPTTREGHMEMTLRASPQPGDATRGAAIVAAGRAVMAQYADVATAERDGFKKFLPNIPLPIEHYTSAANAILARTTFDASRPTSIIYKRTAAGLVVVGVMYTAPNASDEAQLDARVPLSLGTWHRHVDFCRGPLGSFDDPRFGFAGSIATEAACEAAGGRFIPRVFGWMVHVWPTETTPAKIWAVDADESMSAMGHHDGAAPIVADQKRLPIPVAAIPTMAVASGDPFRGAAIFAGNCASCHGAGGENGPDAPRLRESGLSAGQIAYMVRHPKAIDARSEMPEFGFSDRDVADVASYVARLANARATALTP